MFLHLLRQSTHRPMLGYIPFHSCKKFPERRSQTVLYQGSRRLS
ncbi:hypothetical protein EVA_05913 [gut metagenome]|uniref:Uncharacterized protein n=1 Tax=gut metagenome TaxID=749906 RepID=J9GTD3_9ZZZZ